MQKRLLRLKNDFKTKGTVRILWLKGVGLSRRKDEYSKDIKAIIRSHLKPGCVLLLALYYSVIWLMALPEHYRSYQYYLHFTEGKNLSSERWQTLPKGIYCTIYTGLSSGRTCNML